MKSRWQEDEECPEINKRSVEEIDEEQNAVKKVKIEEPISIIQEKRSFLDGPALMSCGLVDKYERISRIEEGSYGIVYKARHKETGRIVALKKLKLGEEKLGFPVTSLREIHTLLLSKHPNIVDVLEIVTTPTRQGIFIVMEFVDYDLKSLIKNMKDPFMQSEVKALLHQLLSAVSCLHENWIIHRDLKTSNLLISNQGQIKVADFGMARLVGNPPGNLTDLVVTLWYRAPEILLGEKEYTSAIDIWSIGCIMGELLTRNALFPGAGEVDQLKKIFSILGSPNEKNWPEMMKLPSAKSITLNKYPHSNLRSKFPFLSQNAFNLLSRFLTYDPNSRITAKEALMHPYFTEFPQAQVPTEFLANTDK